MCNDLGYPDLATLYFKKYYNYNLELYEEDENIYWYIDSLDEDTLTMVKTVYEEIPEDIEEEDDDAGEHDLRVQSQVFVEYPRIFFNTIQFHKWVQWAKKEAVARLASEKEKILKHIEKLYSAYKSIDKQINYLTQSEQ